MSAGFRPREADFGLLGFQGMTPNNNVFDFAWAMQRVSRMFRFVPTLVKRNNSFFFLETFFACLNILRAARQHELLMACKMLEGQEHVLSNNFCTGGGTQESWSSFGLLRNIASSDECKVVIVHVTQADFRTCIIG